MPYWVLPAILPVSVSYTSIKGIYGNILII